MTKELSGQVALVTGGSRGIGRAICLDLASRGANVCIGYAGNEEKANEVKAECENFGVQAITYKADVSKSEEVNAMVQTVIKTFAKIDILVCNAGITRDTLMVLMNETALDDVIDTNLKGTFHCMKAACRPMMKAKKGRIIAISSVVGISGNAGQTNYAASKAGMIGMVKSLAKELATRNITVNAIAPGFIESDMTRELSEEQTSGALAQIPLNRLGKAQEVARAVGFLAGAGAGYITGQVLQVDGGMVM